MSRSLLLGGEDTGRLNDILGAGVLPRDIAGIAMLVHLDDLSIDDQVVIIVAGDFALEVTMGGVVLEHVDLQNRESQFCFLRRMG